MWQRSAPRQPAISSPYQFMELDRDSEYYDDRYLETIPEVDSISSRRPSVQYGLPELPFRAVPPMSEISQPARDHSSTSPTEPTAMPHQQSLRIETHSEGNARAQMDDISPITPRNSRRKRSLDDRPISPLATTVPDHLLARAPPSEISNFTSHIPRKVSQARDGGKSQTKWDDFSGEPTTDDRGKPASVRPGTQPVEANYPHLKERTKQILAGLREREAAKKKQWGRVPPPIAADPLDDPPQREPWKGQSGRTALVEPVKNTVIHRKVVAPPQQTNLQATPTLFYNAATEVHDQHPAFHRQLRQTPSEESIRPVVPLKTRNLTPDMTKMSPADSPTQRTPTQSPCASPEPTTTRSTPPPAATEQPQYRAESPQYDPEPTTPTTPQSTIRSSSDKFPSSPPSFPQPDMDREVSRFSWTTYTTSAAESPRSTIRDFSDLPPMPELTPALMKKHRPTSGASYYTESQGSEVVRKPVPGTRPRTSSLASAASRAISMSKSLPPTPTVTEAGDKIENLEAQLDSLHRRKHNTSRIVGDLEGALKKNAVNYDMWKRREVEKNVANHKSSLDEIGREIHELSIQLHRSQRKRDEKEGLEASSLWVKRVTS